MANNFDWDKGFTLDFSMLNGLSAKAAPTARALSQMRGMFADTEAEDRLIREQDPVIYEFYELGAPENSGDIAFGTSIVYPGKVGNEYFMTKGHFHTILDTAEIYYTLSGEGFMLTENSSGDVVAHRLEAGKAVYVPKGYAHRSVNTGTEKLITFFAFRGDAGHDYGTIETKGFRRLIVEDGGGKPALIENPKWNRP